MLGQRRIRWPNIKSAQSEYVCWLSLYLSIWLRLTCQLNQRQMLMVAVIPIIVKLNEVLHSGKFGTPRPRPVTGDGSGADVLVQGEYADVHRPAYVHIGILAEGRILVHWWCHFGCVFHFQSSGECYRGESGCGCGCGQRVRIHESWYDSGSHDDDEGYADHTAQGDPHHQGNYPSSRNTASAAATGKLFAALPV